MYVNRTLSRVLAAAVASAGFAVPYPAVAATLSCTAASFSAASDANGNINVTCTAAGTTGGTPTPPPTDPPPTNTGTGSASTDCAAAGVTSYQVIEMAWGNSRYFTKGFNSTTVAVFHFRTPATIAPGVSAKIAGAENGGGPRIRHAVLSAKACDFTKVAPASIWGPYTYSDNTSPTVFYSVGGSSTTSYTALAPSTDYYFNVKNDPSTCPAGTNCDMYMDMAKPSGL